MVVMILVADRIEESAIVRKATYLNPISHGRQSKRDNKTIRLVVIVVLALIVAYLLYSAS